MKLPRLLWEGPFFNYSSLALVNRELTRWLLGNAALEVDLLVSDEPDFDPPPPWREAVSRGSGQEAYDFHLRHRWPPNWEPARGRYLLMQPWEFGSLPRSWIDPIRTQVTEVWAYSNYVRETYIRSGIPPERIRVMPLGVNTQLFSETGPSMALPGPGTFRLAFVGGTIPRKGIDVLLLAFTQEFKGDEPVSLIIKDFGPNRLYADYAISDQIQNLRQESHPNLHYLSGNWSEVEMAAFYRGIDLLVQPYRGEGFGLPIVEAMATGKPVVVTGFGPSLDYCSPETTYLIDVDLARGPRAQVENVPTVDFPVWAEPNVDHLRALLREAVTHPEATAARGRLGQENIRHHFTWEQSAAKMAHRLAELDW